MKLTPRQHTLVEAVRIHAIENYNIGGWDVIVECYDDEAIAKVIGRARTVKGALAKFAPIIEVLADRQAEAAYQIRAAVGDDEPATPAGEPDGSVVATRYAYDGELISATRTWPGKVGYAVINLDRYDDSEPAEHYVPGWAGQIIDTPDYCGHRGKRAPGCWDCGGSPCNTKAHPECEPPF